MKANRSIAIEKINIKGGKEKADFLYQWNYTRKMSNGIKYAFVSVIQKGKEVYLDKPYYCYSGEHRYRKLSKKLTIAVKLAGFYGAINKIKRQVKNKINDLKCEIIMCKAKLQSRIENYRFMRSLEKSLK